MPKSWIYDVYVDKALASSVCRCPNVLSVPLSFPVPDQVQFGRVPERQQEPQEAQRSQWVMSTEHTQNSLRLLQKAWLHHWLQSKFGSGRQTVLPSCVAHSATGIPLELSGGRLTNETFWAVLVAIHYTLVYNIAHHWQTIPGDTQNFCCIYTFETTSFSRTKK